MNQQRRRPELVTARNHREVLARIRDREHQKELLKSSDRRRNYERGRLSGMALVGGIWSSGMGLESDGWIGLARITLGAALIIVSFSMRYTFWRETQVHDRTQDS